MHKGRRISPVPKVESQLFGHLIYGGAVAGDHEIVDLALLQPLMLRASQALWEQEARPAYRCGCPFHLPKKSPTGEDHMFVPLGLLLCIHMLHEIEHALLGSPSPASCITPWLTRCFREALQTGCDVAKCWCNLLLPTM